MRVLVTGGVGFIGSHIAEHFSSRAQVRVLDNLRSGFRENLAGLDVDFIEWSITDRDVVRKAVQGVDYIFHLAAMVSVLESIESRITLVRNRGSRMQTNPTPGTIEIAIVRGQVVMDTAERVDLYAGILLQLVIGGKKDFHTVFSVHYRFSSKGLLKIHFCRQR
jgi:NAD(P)-dependent dehydrogenase (short-subunit alcohol dehydrogenase family)